MDGWLHLPTSQQMGVINGRRVQRSCWHLWAVVRAKETSYDTLQLYTTTTVCNGLFSRTSHPRVFPGD